MRDPRDKDFAMAVTRLILETYPELPEAHPKIVSGITDVLACCFAGVVTGVAVKHGQEPLEMTLEFFNTRFEKHFNDILQKMRLLSEEKPPGPEGEN